MVCGLDHLQLETAAKHQPRIAKCGSLQIEGRTHERLRRSNGANGLNGGLMCHVSASSRLAMALWRYGTLYPPV